MNCTNMDETRCIYDLYSFVSNLVPFPQSKIILPGFSCFLSKTAKKSPFLHSMVNSQLFYEDLLCPINQPNQYFSTLMIAQVILIFLKKGITLISVPFCEDFGTPKSFTHLPYLFTLLSPPRTQTSLTRLKTF